MNLPKMIFSELEPNDFFGLKILKNGYNPDYLSNDKKENPGASPKKMGARFGRTNHKISDTTQPTSWFDQDVIVLEEKKMNTTVKVKYLDDFT